MAQESTTFGEMSRKGLEMLESASVVPDEKLGIRRGAKSNKFIMIGIGAVVFLIMAGAAYYFQMRKDSHPPLNMGGDKMVRVETGAPSPVPSATPSAQPATMTPQPAPVAAQSAPVVPTTQPASSTNPLAMSDAKAAVPSAFPAEAHMSNVTQVSGGMPSQSLAKVAQEQPKPVEVSTQDASTESKKVDAVEKPKKVRTKAPVVAPTAKSKSESAKDVPAVAGSTSGDEGITREEIIILKEEK